MGAAGRIAVKDLKLRVRDRSAFIIGIIAPLALAYIFYLIFGGALGAQSIDLQFGLVDQDSTEISEALGQILSEVESEGLLVVTEYEDEAAAEAAVDGGDIDAYILLAPGLADASLQGNEYTIEVVGSVDSPTATQIAASIAEQFGSGIGQAQLSVGTAVALLGGPPPADVASWGQEAAERPRAFSLEDISAETRQLDASTYLAAGMAIFFLFFTVQFGVLGLLEEERDGTLARLLAAPIARTSVVTGKALVSIGLGVVSMTILVLATHFLMGATWGAPLGVALLIGAGVLAAVSIIGLIAGMAKTPEGAGNLGAIIAVILGMLGGTFFPVGQAGGFLSSLTFITPHAWFMHGLAEISGGAEWTAALPSVGALLLIGLVFGSVGWILLNRRLAR